MRELQEPQAEVRGDYRELEAPLGGAREGRLVFASGAARLSLDAGAATDRLYQGRFTGRIPEVEVDGGGVVVRYRWGLAGLGLSFGSLWSAAMSLNRELPWALEVRGGLARVEADLARIRVSEIEIRGGASHVRLSLGPPAGIVPVRIRGGVSHLEVERPVGVAVRLRVHGGASRLTLDSQGFGAIGGEVRLESAGASAATDLYDVEVLGGASRLSIRVV